MPSDGKRWSRGTDFSISSLRTRIMDSFSCSPLNTSYYIGKKIKRLYENPEYAEMRHGDVILTLQRCHVFFVLFFVIFFLFFFCLFVFRFLSFPWAGTG